MLKKKNINKDEEKKKRAYDYYGVVPAKNRLSSSVIRRCHYNFVINVCNET